MAASVSGWSAMDPSFETQNGAVDRLKKLYPAVNEEKSPLPRAWSAKEKYNYIGLSQNNLRVHYKGLFQQQSVLQSSTIPFLNWNWTLTAYFTSDE